MRRRPPRRIHLPDKAQAFLEDLVRDGRTEQRVARRARILLAMARPDTVVEALAEKLEVSRKMIWDIGRRYERSGVDAVFDAPRSGRPRAFSPPCSGLRSSNSHAAPRRVSDYT